jgi:hypothetical protein
MSGTREAFFSEKNEQMLDRLLYDHVQRKNGVGIDDRQKQRLVKTVKHYMGEVYRVNTGATIQVLNKEVLGAVLPDYTAYLDRQRQIEVSEKTEVEVVNSTDPLRTDVGTRFALMQESRNEVKAKPPAPPDFRIPLEEDESTTALTLFDQARKQREAEAARTALAVQEQLRPTEAGTVPRPRTLENEIPNSMPMPPDMRSLFGMPSNGRTLYTKEASSLPQANPTIATPTVRSERGVLPQDFLQKEDDTINYKENEFNLFCYSADRDWTVNTGENRYNFTVNFNPGNVITNNGIRPNTSTQIRFKNIVRIELVKTLVPVEGIDTLINRDISGAAVGGQLQTRVFNTTINTNALSFPYLMLRAPELETNNVGTNYGIDSAFGLLQYDANWISDNANVTQRGGYLAMIPKFMKCQKVYHPTPLSTLQKLTLQIQRPDGTLLSSVPDTLDISGFVLSNSIGDQNLSTYYSKNGAGGGYSQYIWIQTTNFFSRFMFTQGDRVQLKNIAFTSAFSGAAATTQDFINFVTGSQGLLIINIGWKNGSVYTTGSNTVGYANYIIVESQYYDPTTGSSSVKPFGGVTNDNFATALNNAGVVQTGRLINLSHQVQVVFRVITRDMDSASRLRPDNLN